MKKPAEAIEWLRGIPQHGTALKQLLSYLDSIPEDAHVCKWPEVLTRERLNGLAERSCNYQWAKDEALRALAAIAPEKPQKPQKRTGFLYERDDPILKKVRVWDEIDHEILEPGWRKVGGPFEIEE